MTTTNVIQINSYQSNVAPNVTNNAPLVLLRDIVHRQAASTPQTKVVDILPPVSELDELSYDERTAEPIKSLDDIRRITKHLVACERYRDNMLFILGINFGLRVSDLSRLRFCDIINPDGSFKKSFRLLEKKTSHTRATTKRREITINEAVRNAVCLYLDHVLGVHLDDYLFVHERNNVRVRNTPMTRDGIHKNLKKLQDECELDIRFSSHSLRKTFGYHQLLMSNNDPRKLLLLQQMFGHSSSTITLRYIGITNDEIAEAYRDLNLGGNDYEMIGELRTVES